MGKSTTKRKKPKSVSYCRVPGKLWRMIKKHLPSDKRSGRGRPRASNRAVINGIWYVLWTGCQWKAIEKEWFGVSSSVIHERFQTWTQQGVFEHVLAAMLRYYGRRRHIRWVWQSVDSRSSPAPLGGNDTGKNPTDRAKLGGKIHILVDQQGAPLSIHVTGANENDKWYVTALILSILVQRPRSTQHFCADKAYDSWDVHLFVKEQGYVDHIKHRRRRNEPKEEECPIPGEYKYPARRWVVERTLSWLVRRRSIRTRWCKKPENWRALIQFACADIVFNMAFYG
jgi:putative transposase